MNIDFGLLLADWIEQNCSGHLHRGETLEAFASSHFGESFQELAHEHYSNQQAGGLKQMGILVHFHRSLFLEEHVSDTIHVSDGGPDDDEHVHVHIAASQRVAGRLVEFIAKHELNDGRQY